MRIGSRWQRLHRSLLATTLAFTAGGTTLALTSCDSETTELMMSSFQDMASSLLDAAFTAWTEQLTADATDSTTTTTTTSKIGA